MKLFLAAIALALSACGVADTGTAAATAAALKAKDAERAKDAQSRIQGQLEEANSQASQRLEKADAAGR